MAPPEWVKSREACIGRHKHWSGDMHGLRGAVPPVRFPRHKRYVTLDHCCFGDASLDLMYLGPWAMLKMRVLYLRSFVLVRKCPCVLVPLSCGHGCSMTIGARVSMLLKECVSRDTVPVYGCGSITQPLSSRSSNMALPAASDPGCQHRLPKGSIRLLQ